MNRSALWMLWHKKDLLSDYIYFYLCNFAFLINDFTYQDWNTLSIMRPAEKNANCIVGLAYLAHNGQRSKVEFFFDGPWPLTLMKQQKDNLIALGFPQILSHLVFTSTMVINLWECRWLVWDMSKKQLNIVICTAASVSMWSCPLV